MSADVHSERFILNQFGLHSCQGILPFNENNFDSDLSKQDDNAIQCKTKKSVMLNCFYINPFETKKKCQTTKRELYLDFSYFCILIRELLDSKVFRNGFIERWYSNKTSLTKRDNCHASESFNQNKCCNRGGMKDESSTKTDNQHPEGVQYNLLVKISDEMSNSKQFEVTETSVLVAISNPVETELILNNEYFLSLPAVTLYISGPVPIFMDKRWCGMLHQSVQERIQLDISMSWLSTLGGACSALGDYSPDWATKAALISSQQMTLAWRIGDPHILARCRLYAAIALIQSGNYKAASAIIRREYDALRRQPAELRDRRLAKMCQGIWVKLLYTKKFGRLT